MIRAGIKPPPPIADGMRLGTSAGVRDAKNGGTYRSSGQALQGSIVLVWDTGGRVDAMSDLLNSALILSAVDWHRRWMSLYVCLKL